MRFTLPKSLTVRTVLIAFGLAMSLPLVIVLAILLLRSAAAERAELEQRLLQVVTSLSEGIDRDLDRWLALLQTLATSQLLQREDWPGFYAQATASLQERAYIVLIDRTGRQLVNTYVPYGQAPEFTGDPATLQRMLASRSPVVSDLFVSLVVKKPVFNISIPILRDGAVRYVMSLGLQPSDVRRILLEQGLDPSWVSTVWDRNDTLLARSRDQDQYVGQRLPERFRVNRSQGTTVFRTINLDNEQVLLANTTSRLAGWRVAVSVPLGAAEEPIRASFLLWSSIATLAVLVAAGLAALLGNLLVRPLVAAADAARAFGRGGEIGPIPQSRLHEVDALTSVLHEAGERQRLLVRELSHRVKNVLAVVQALVSRSIAEGRPSSQVRDLVEQRLQALGRAHDVLIRGDWRGASLVAIAAVELAPYAERAMMSGPDLRLNAGVVQSLVLILHELATNAVKHGALSKPEGEVSLIWRVQRSRDAETFHLQWQERGGPEVSPPATRGFGTLLLEGAFPSGRAGMAFDPVGFTYTLDAPLAAITAGPAAS